MIQCTRPPAHPDFLPHSGSPVQQAKRQVEDAIQAGQKPTFRNLWKKCKHVFARNQHYKCGYCESIVLATDFGDIDHFAPKGEVHELIAPGQEANHLSKVIGRNWTIVSDRGYWWLAYDWKNYIFSCKLCNTVWKLSLFPVCQSPRQIPPDPAVPEARLLLNPFEDDPVPHFEFSEFGQIRGKTDEGRATVAVCGLDRLSLFRKRREKAQLVFGLLKEMLVLANREDEPLIIKKIYEMGKQENEHAGMVRSIIANQLRLDWRQIEEYLRAAGHL
jgi:hypothetical protein